MKKVFIILIVMLITTKIEAHKLTPTSRGYCTGGSFLPNSTVYFSGSTSYDNDSQNGGYSPLWLWDFDYQGGAISFAPNNSSVSHVYTKPGNYTVAVQYRDNDGQLGNIYTFPITIIGMERFYYVKDHLGSIRQTINEEGEIVAAQDYYAYGEIIPGRSYNAGMTDENIKFTEKERDTETNYDYFGARYYNSKLGIWMSVDPMNVLLPGLSPYNYCQNNPLIRIDPNGMWDYRTNAERLADGMRDAGGGNSSSGDDNSGGQNSGGSDEEKNGKNKSNEKKDNMHDYETGLITEDMSIKAQLGQGVEIVFKNLNVLGVAFNVQQSFPPLTDKVEKIEILPYKSRKVVFTSFGNEPMTWKIDISLFSEAAVIEYKIRSTWIPGMPYNPPLQIKQPIN